jgi:hypothetical protein
VGDKAEIKGKNASGTWWYVQHPANPNLYCWVAASVTTTAGNLANIPVRAAPNAQITNVTVDADVNYNACGGPNPVDFSGTITTNGPLTVTYRWEIRGDREFTLSNETLNFDKADTKNVPSPGALHLDCGDYRVIIHILSPTDSKTTKAFSIP